MVHIAKGHILKMKIEYYNGCTSSSLSVDGVYIDEENFDREKLIEVATAILNKLSNSSLEYVVKDLVQSNSTDYEDFGRCEQCGDYPCSYKLEI